MKLCLLATVFLVGCVSAPAPKTQINHEQFHCTLGSFCHDGYAEHHKLVPAAPRPIPEVYVNMPEMKPQSLQAETVKKRSLTDTVK